MERLCLLPTEHWDGDKLKGVSVYIYKDGRGFIGNFICAPNPIEKVAEMVATHLNKSGYKTTTYLHGKNIEGDLI